MALFKILQGLDAKKPSKLTEGYCYFTIDNNMFYVDHNNSSGTLVRSPLNAQNAHTISSNNGNGDVASVVHNMSSLTNQIPSCSAVYEYLQDFYLPLVGGAISGDLSVGGIITGTLNGNAATATKFATTKKINGTAFDGSVDIVTSYWGTARNFTIVDANNENSGLSASVNGSADVLLRLPGTIKATLNGTADKAIQDVNGNNIVSTYATIDYVTSVVNNIQTSSTVLIRIAEV